MLTKSCDILPCQGLEASIRGLGLKVWGLGFKGLGFRGLGSGFRGLGLRVYGRGVCLGLTREADIETQFLLGLVGMAAQGPDERNRALVVHLRGIF